MKPTPETPLPIAWWTGRADPRLSRLCALDPASLHARPLEVPRTYCGLPLQPTWSPQAPDGRTLCAECTRLLRARLPEALPPSP